MRQSCGVAERFSGLSMGFQALRLSQYFFSFIIQHSFLPEPLYKADSFRLILIIFMTTEIISL
jgi:hypothetical protein